MTGMLWLTWRQHRWALLGTLALTVVLVAWMSYLAVDIAHLHAQCHAAECPRYSPQHAALFADYGPIVQAEYLSLLVYYAPLLIGVFLGVPLLAREHEQRTLLLAWSQDISPVRWLWTKLALLGLFVAIVTGALAVVTDRLAQAYSGARGGGGLFSDRIFLVTGMLPLTGSLCWFALGVALGAIIRRTLPAVFAVLAGCIGLMLATQWRYPTLMKPLSFYRRPDELGPLATDRNALVINGRIGIAPGLETNLYDTPGHELSFDDLQRLCPSIATDPDPSACITQHHLLAYVTYQPGSRMAAFHLMIAGGHLALAAVALLAVWLIVRRTNLSAG